VDYRHDVFISYARSGPSLGWVRDVLVPRLRDELVEAHSRELTVFCDEQIEDGARWPDELREALGASRLLVPVIGHAFRRSAWCSWELETMRRRAAAQPKHAAIILPVLIGDAHDLPTWLADIQTRFDVRGQHYTDAAFRESQDFVAVARLITKLAQTIGGVVDAAPAWSADFPMEQPPAPIPPSGALRRLE
jgi:hypothetical protein